MGVMMAIIAVKCNETLAEDCRSIILLTLRQMDRFNLAMTTIVVPANFQRI